MRKPTVIVGMLLLIVAAVAAAKSGAPTYPGLIPLPGGFGPEGIAVGNGATFYVGAGPGSAPIVLGRILVGDLQTGGLAQLVAPTGRPALGIKFDPRSNLLFVAGGPSGRGIVYDAATGVEVAFHQFHPAHAGPPPFSTFVNDVVVTRDAAYFTDSAVPFLYRVALGPQGELSDRFELVPLPAAFGGTPNPPLCGGILRANGIAATPSGKYLIIGHTSAGQIYWMDTANHAADQIDLGGADVCNADGLLLDGGALYVSQNVNNRIAVVELSADYLSGVVTRHISEPFASNVATKVPTTIAEFGHSLYVVTAGFAPPAPDFVVRLPK